MRYTGLMVAKKSTANKKIIVACSAIAIIIIGWICWSVTRPDNPIRQVAPQVSQLGEDGEASFSITPETKEQEMVNPLASDDPQTERRLQAELEESNTEYCSPFEKVCFNYPAGWALTDTSADGRERVELISPRGAHLLWQTHTETETCATDEPKAALTAVIGDLKGVNYRLFITRLGHKIFEYRRLGLITFDELPHDSSGRLPKLGAQDFCISEFGPTFPSRQDASVRIAFRTTGLDVIDPQDIEMLEQVFKSLRTQ